jgi:hypothetical protein
MGIVHIERRGRFFRRLFSTWGLLGVLSIPFLNSSRRSPMQRERIGSPNIF